MHLLTEYHKPRSEARHKEYIHCLKKNIGNPQLRGIHIFIENGTGIPDFMLDSKVSVIEKKNRPNYSDFFKYSSDNIPGEITIIANTDIVISEGFDLLDPTYMENKFLCLSRWDYHAGNLSHYDLAYSQDTWVYKSPIDIPNSDYTLGILGCDNRIAFEAHKSGFDVRNPSGVLKTIHYHESNYRTYKPQDTLMGNYLFVYNTSDLEDVPQKIMCDPKSIGEAVTMVRMDRTSNKF